MNCIKIISFIVLMIVVISFFDKALALGFALLALLTVATVLILLKRGIRTKEVYILFAFALFVFFVAVLFTHYASFQPFSGGFGDYMVYHSQAEDIAFRIWQRNFSLEGIAFSHYYPVIIGYIYALTMSSMIIGLLFNVWTSAIAMLLLYFIAREIGVSRRAALIVGFIATLYPSFVFFSSLLLKESVVMVLALAGLLVLLRLLKSFSWKIFLLFYIILVALVDFRFYIGLALIMTFLLSWFFLSRMPVKKRFLYALIMLPLLGTASQPAGVGYYGIETIQIFTKPSVVHYFKEVVYNPPTQLTEESQVSEPASLVITSTTPATGTIPPPAEPTPPAAEPTPPAAEPIASRLGVSSSIEFETGFESPLSFIWNSSKSFFYVLFGPIPGQLKETKHLFTLFEMIPWYILLFLIGKGVLRSFQHYRIALPLLIFAFGIFVILSLFMSNFGVIARLRMPAFVALLCFVPLAFKKWKYDKSQDTVSGE